MDYDKAKVWEWITSYWTGARNCPVCESTDWVLLDKVWELREFHGGSLHVGSGPILPVVGLMCNVCGHTLFFNAIAARAVRKDESSEADDE